MPDLHDLHDLHDRLAILDVLNRHQIAIDRRDADAYADVFTPDGRFDSPFAQARGRHELKEMTLALHASGFTNGKRHFLGPVEIDIDGDTARAFSYWWVADTLEQQPAVFASGSYTDRLEKIGGHWKIARRLQHADPDALTVAAASANNSTATPD